MIEKNVKYGSLSGGMKMPPFRYGDEENAHTRVSVFGDR